jgi:chloramphenicol O-acetyltransferase type A
MHIISIESWPRRNHFELFHGFDYPHFNLCAPVDITHFLAAVKNAQASFTSALMYALARTANQAQPFRWRIRGKEVVEHEAVHPAPTVLTDNDLFAYYAFSYDPDFSVFAHRENLARSAAKADPRLADEPGRDDYLYLSGIPWVAFTSLSHPIHMHPDDSVPRMSWGKYYSQGQSVKMPLSVQVNHALMDGVHVGRYFESVQALLDDCSWLNQ